MVVSSHLTKCDVSNWIISRAKIKQITLELLVPSMICLIFMPSTPPKKHLSILSPSFLPTKNSHVKPFYMKKSEISWVKPNHPTPPQSPTNFEVYRGTSVKRLAKNMRRRSKRYLRISWWENHGTICSYIYRWICSWNLWLVGGWTNSFEKHACQIGSFLCMKAQWNKISLFRGFP